MRNPFRPVSGLAFRRQATGKVGEADGRWMNLSVIGPYGKPTETGYVHSAYLAEIYSGFFPEPARIRAMTLGPDVGTTGNGTKAYPDELFPHLQNQRNSSMFKGGLLWLIGIPLPIILVLYFMGYLH